MWYNRPIEWFGFSQRRDRLDQKPVRVAVVGVGYFGAIHCAKIAGLPGATLEAVVDTDAMRGSEVARRYGTQAFRSHKDLIGKVDAAVVAVPTSAHHAVAADLLAAGLDLLIEKPLAETPDEAAHLCHLAKRNALCLQVGHLERFNPVLMETLRRIQAPKYVRMERTGPFSGRGADVDVVLELMIHDLDILLQLTKSPVKSVAASGQALLSPYLDFTTARVEFEDGLVADLLASRVGPNISRKFFVLDAHGTLEVDLGSRTILRKGYHGECVREENAVYGCTTFDPLMDQDRAFVEVLRNGRKPKVSGDAGMAAVTLASRILDNIRPGGCR